MEKRTLDANPMACFEKANTEEHRDFINMHNNCALCGTVLELKHSVLDDNSQIKEEAHCPECEMRTRAKIHTLQ